MKDQITLLTEQQLTSPQTRTGDALRPAFIQHAVVSLGVGLDLVTGERPLAFVDDIYTGDGGLRSEIIDGLLVTDRRSILGRTGVSVPHHEVRGARQSPQGPDHVEIVGESGSWTVQSSAASAIQAFFTALSQLPPNQRMGLERPLRQPFADDPLGILETINTLPRHDDPRANQLLALAPDPRMRPEIPPNVAGDLADRIALFERTVHRGRGMNDQGRWLSPLAVSDFVFATFSILGAPAGRRTEATGEQVLTYNLGDDTAQAVLSSLAGIVSGALLGFGWIRMPKSTSVEIQIGTYGPFAAFTVRAVGGDALAASQYLHEVLHVFEGQLTLLRTIYGWTTPPDQLFAVAPQTLADQCKQLVGFSAISAFLPEVQGDAAAGLDGLSPDMQAIIDAELSKTPEQRQAEVRAALEDAKAEGDPDALADAALRLQHEQLYDEAIAAYTLLGTDFETHRADAARSLGDCYLFRATIGGAPIGPHSAPDLEQALSWYNNAREYGATVSYLDENYWESCKSLSEIAQDPARRQGALNWYLQLFPQGEHASEALALLKG